MKILIIEDDPASLPGIKGLAVARQCRDEQATRDIPIIAITSFSAEYGESEALKGGCDAYVVKPINTRTLLQLNRGGRRRQG
jgi:CheY-like chemotaxis protein